MVSSSREENFLIREINIEGRDIELVEKLERDCTTEIGSKKEGSIFTNIIAGPFSRIRFYPLHVVLVAELLKNGELVGVVKGCIKILRAAFGELRDVNIGCILGLRVSPTHRRKGIGQKLVSSIEEWVVKNGANYTFLATEKTNIPSRNLFTIKCNYLNLSSLVIFVHQPISSTSTTSHIPNNDFPQHIKIEKLHVDEAISLYTNKLRHKKEFYPADIDVILKEKLNLGSWICYFKDEDEGEDAMIRKTQSSSWAIFSIWNNSCDTYNNNNNNNNNMLQITKSYFSLRFLHSSLSRARKRISQCMRNSVSERSSNSFGYIFLYGLHGEGENVGKLMKYIWDFTSRSILGKKVKDCKVIITELGVCDPLIKHVPKESCISCINDVWYAKNLVTNVSDKDNELLMKGPIGNVIVDPRDF